MNYQNKNEIIFKVFDMINTLYEEAGGDESQNYYHKIMFLRLLDSFSLDHSLRNTLEQLLYENNIQNLGKNLYLIFNPGSDMTSVSDEQLSQYSLDDLSDIELVHYFTTFCKSVTFVQKDNLLLLKYSKCIFETGWNEFAKLSRGKVIDLETMKIVSYPYDKFFNLNEMPDYSMDTVAKAIDEAEAVFVTNKLDGSLIAITRYKDGYIVNTNGSFDNMHTEIAKKMLFTKYNYFASTMPYDHTFIFELISAEDKHCLNYDNIDEGLYLTGIRSLATHHLYDYPTMLKMAQEYRLNITEQEHLSLDEMLLKRTEKAQNKEGWVMRIISSTNDLLVKIKYEEFLIMHRMKSGINVRKAYNFYCFEDVSTLLESLPPDVAEGYLAVIEEININRQRITEKIISVAADVCNSLNIDMNSSISTSDSKRIAAEVYKIKDQSIKPFAFMAMSYIRRKSISRSIEMLQYDKYQKLIDAL